MVAARASQTLLSVLHRRGTGVANVRASQVIMSVLTTRPRVNPPPSFPVTPGAPTSGFPALRGLAYSMLKTVVGSTSVQQHRSGREVRINYFPAPLWQWEMTFDYLPDTGVVDPLTTPNVSDYQLLRSFFTATYGGAYPFLLFDPDDNQVTGQFIATTDGSTRAFQLVRSYGAGGFTTTEPVGFVNATAFPFNVYLNGSLVSTSSYKLTTTQYGNQVVTFNLPPAAGQALTVDMTYYFFARFIDPFLEFEEFLHRIYMLKKLRIESRRSA